MVDFHKKEKWNHHQGQGNENILNPKPSLWWLVRLVTLNRFPYIKSDCMATTNCTLVIFLCTPYFILIQSQIYRILFLRPDSDPLVLDQKHYSICKPVSNHPMDQTNFEENCIILCPPYLCLCTTHTPSQECISHHQSVLSTVV